jgi:hypothetical protein
MSLQGDKLKGDRLPLLGHPSPALTVITPATPAYIQILPMSLSKNDLPLIPLENLEIG